MKIKKLLKDGVLIDFIFIRQFKFLSKCYKMPGYIPNGTKVNTFIEISENGKSVDTICWTGQKGFAKKEIKKLYGIDLNKKVSKGGMLEDFAELEKEL